MNKTTVKHEAMRVLHESAGHPLAQDVFRAQVQSRVKPRPSDEDTDTCIQELKASGHIIDMPNDFDSANPLWMLDEKGKAYAVLNRFH